MVDKFKVWLFPTVVTILSMMIWHDVRQIQEDVKLLMAQSNIDKTRIDNLERRVDKIESAIFQFSKPITSATNIKFPTDIVFIKEEEYDIKKYLKRQS